MCLGPNFASVAKEILLSMAPFVLWKRAILCAFSGCFGHFQCGIQGKTLDEPGYFRQCRRYSYSVPHQLQKEKMAVKEMKRAG
jgi:hypothetical protein